MAIKLNVLNSMSSSAKLINFFNGIGHKKGLPLKWGSPPAGTIHSLHFPPFFDSFQINIFFPHPLSATSEFIAVHFLSSIQCPLQPLTKSPLLNPFSFPQILQILALRTPAAIVEQKEGRGDVTHPRPESALPVVAMLEWKGLGVVIIEYPSSIPPSSFTFAFRRHCAVHFCPGTNIPLSHFFADSFPV